MHTVESGIEESISGAIDRLVLGDNDRVQDVGGCIFNLSQIVFFEVRVDCDDLSNGKVVFAEILVVEGRQLIVELGACWMMNDMKSTRQNSAHLQSQCTTA